MKIKNGRGERVRLISKTFLPSNDPATPRIPARSQDLPLSARGYNSAMPAGPPRAKLWLTTRSDLSYGCRCGTIRDATVAT